jgi:hypothetical protein
MPYYTLDVNDPKNLIDKEKATSVFKECRRGKEKALIGFLWLTGARPSELREIKKEHVIVSENGFSVTINTKKLGRSGDFNAKQRILTFERTHGCKLNIFAEAICQYVESLPNGALLFPHKNGWFLGVTQKAGMVTCKMPYTPYHFRHSCFSWLVRTQKKSLWEMMYFKGSADTRSVMAYVKLLPTMVKLENDGVQAPDRIDSTVDEYENKGQVIDPNEQAEARKKAVEDERNMADLKAKLAEVDLLKKKIYGGD